ncbi:MAG: L-histidine N(alpha)-methyltransferase [Bacteroidota bacterium]
MTAADNISIQNILPEGGASATRQELIEGLRASQKRISPKYFYDRYGSKLFEQITQLDEYYPTRAEKAILNGLISQIGIDFANVDIIELGSGDASKISILLSQIPEDILSTISYYPVDISSSAIAESVEEISSNYTLTGIRGTVANFLNDFSYLPENHRKVICFFGSTIGNLSSDQVDTFMKSVGDIMQEGDILLLGTDLVKDTSIIEAAYNDQDGVTAEFNKNILRVVNGHLNSNFAPSDFEHKAGYNDAAQRIEMHLVAKTEMEINLSLDQQTIHIAKGETIHTESSHKFTQEQLSALGKSGDLTMQKIHSDENQYFCIAQYTK